MDKLKDLNYYMKLNYNAILKKINDRYYLFIPELSLITEGKDLKEAYASLEEQKENHFRKIIEMNMQNTVKEPMPIILRKKLLGGLCAFFVKITIVAVICVVVFISSLPFISALAARSIKQVLSNSKSFITELSTKAYQDLSNMPAEEKENLRLKFRKMLWEIKPFVDETRALWKDEIVR